MEKIIGIDTGTTTGLCIMDVQTEVIELLYSCDILKAMEVVKQYYRIGTVVYVEDARKCTVGRNNVSAKLQGVGSVKRDAKIWETYLQAQGYDYVMVSPTFGATKLTKARFEAYTNYTGKSNNHSRDAGMIALIYSRKYKINNK